MMDHRGIKYVTFQLFLWLQLFLFSNAIETSYLYGDINKYGYYFVDLLIGTPPQVVSVIVDTGSTVISFPCHPCTHCGNHLDPLFDTTISTTARWTTCEQCNQYIGECTKTSDDNEGRCVYSQSYLEGSRLRGHWFEDFFSLKQRTSVTFKEKDTDQSTVTSPESENNADTISNVLKTETKYDSMNERRFALLGCHDLETKLFYTQRADGIFGLAPCGKKIELEETFINTTKESIEDSQSSTLLNVTSIGTAAHQLLGYNEQFSLCFAHHGGLLQLGGIDPNIIIEGEKEIITPLIVHQRYVIEVTSMDVSTGPKVPKSQNFPIHTAYSAIVDSGSTFSYLPKPIYDTIVAQISQYLGSVGPCWNEHALWRVGQSRYALNQPSKLWPNITFYLAGNEHDGVVWQPEDYLYLQQKKKTGSTTLSKKQCLAFASLNGSGDSTPVLGASWMQRKNLVFDIKGQQLKISRANCPEYRVAERVVSEPLLNNGISIDLVHVVGILFILLIACGIYDNMHRQSSSRSFECCQSLQLHVPLEPIQEEDASMECQS